MRRFSASAILLFASCILNVSARGQNPPPVASCASTSLQEPAGAYPPPPGVCPPPPGAYPPPPVLPVTAQPFVQPVMGPEREPVLAIEAMLGQELGVRGQIAVYRDNREVLVVEGFYGELFTDEGSSQALSAGARYLIRSNWLDSIGSLQLGGGVDVLFQLKHDGMIFLDPSLNIGWTEKIAPGIEWEIGLEGGLGIGVAGRTSHGNSGAGDLTPLISLYTGLRF